MRRHGGFIALAVHLNCHVAWAQIYQFNQLAVPANRSLHTLYAFYVYSHDDAPERPLGFPFVKFHDLAAHSSSGTLKDEDMKEYGGIQLSIMRYKNFWELINPKKFCCAQADVASGQCKAKDQLMVRRPPGVSESEVDIYKHTVRFPLQAGEHPQDVKMNVRKTGVYILVLSNCGSFVDAVISGSVVVKNAYGFLPGNEYHKMPFYGWLLLIYGIMAVVWMLLTVRWWTETFNIQNCIAVVIFLGLVEAFLWYIFYNDWNSTGMRGKFLFVMAILSSVVKSIFSYMLVLVASLGWGVTRPFLDRQVILKIQAVSCVYIFLDFIRETVLSFRHSHSLSLAFVLLCLLPVSLLNGGIFYWVFTALSKLIESLKDRRQSEKLIVFQRLWKILLLALTVATATLLFQIFNLSRSISTRWKYQWFFADGVSHLLFLFVLAAMMYLWAPHKYSQRYAYSQQVDDRDTDPSAKPDSANADIWAVDEADNGDDDEDDSFWATTHGGKDAGSKPNAEVIGVQMA
eukprot:gnl/TRDRNA2_/TRDRNA2_134894_c1_seq1.p1 gnl/TRDRNA2_/TRDRNA2_134894_c1~~gnl/TRDRNA2_/TRDRNA2_134894_c1_seq1.p1  ORF type:complete len:532 (+),score=102.35 gnl/TRDRNA2_/TRDRNA2_134894_c1_seq1:53-1597(+)